MRRTGDHWDLMQAASGDADPQRVRLPMANTRLLDVSADGGSWLLGTFAERGAPMELWRRPAAGGAPVRLGGLRANEALWDPDGQSIIYTLDDGLYRARGDGSGTRKLAALAGAASWLAWSPDQRELSLTISDDAGNPSLWRWQAGATAPLRLSAAGPPAPRCCGQWTGDGRYFLYSALHDGVWSLWAQRESGGLLAWRARPPTQLTFGPQSDWGAFTGHSNGEVIFYTMAERERPQRLEVAAHRFEPLLNGRNAIQLEYSPDGRQLAFRDAIDGTIWTAEISAAGEASNLRRLTLPGADAKFPHWSPDGRWVVYQSQPPGGHERAMVVAAEGGAPEPLLAAPLGDTDVLDAGWEPDGKRLILSLDRHAAGGYSLAVFDRASGTLSALPGSAGLFGASASADGRWLAANSGDQSQIKVYNIARQSWRVIATGHGLVGPVWSRDSRSVYYQDLLAPGEPLFRAAAPGWQGRQVAEFSAEIRAGMHRCGFMSLAPGGEPLISFNSGFANLRRAWLELP